MTSIRYYRTPAVVKLDRRYKGYNRGFRYRIDFDTQGEKWEVWMRAFKWCENSYGKEYSWAPNGFARIWNDEYRTELGSRNKYYRHLYLRREEDVTMLLLVVGG